jgi:hypothetical protein
MRGKTKTSNQFKKEISSEKVGIKQNQNDPNLVDLTFREKVLEGLTQKEAEGVAELLSWAKNEGVL